MFAHHRCRDPKNRIVSDDGALDQGEFDLFSSDCAYNGDADTNGSIGTKTRCAERG